MATANPNFHLQQQALSSLRQVHLVCMVLEGLQLCASIVTLSMGYAFGLRELSSAAHLYAVLLYLFSAVFAHVVVFYVLLSVAKSVNSIEMPAKKALPYFVTHLSLIFASILLRSPMLQHALAWSATAFGIVVVVRVFYALRHNTKLVTLAVHS